MHPLPYPPTTHPYTRKAPEVGDIIQGVWEGPAVRVLKYIKLEGKKGNAVVLVFNTRTGAKRGNKAKAGSRKVVTWKPKPVKKKRSGEKTAGKTAEEPAKGGDI